MTGYLQLNMGKCVIRMRNKNNQSVLPTGGAFFLYKKNQEGGISDGRRTSNRG